MSSCGVLEAQSSEAQRGHWHQRLQRPQRTRENIAAMSLREDGDIQDLKYQAKPFNKTSQAFAQAVMGI